MRYTEVGLGQKSVLGQFTGTTRMSDMQRRANSILISGETASAESFSEQLHIM